MDAVRDLHVPFRRRSSAALAVRAPDGSAAGVPAGDPVPLLLADGAGRARVLDRLQSHAGNAAVQRMIQTGLGVPADAPIGLQRCGGERHDGCEHCS